ncbi:MAG: phosphotransferase [Caldilineaceae bacterium]
MLAQNSTLHPVASSPLPYANPVVAEQPQATDSMAQTDILPLQVALNCTAMTPLFQPFFGAREQEWTVTDAKLLDCKAGKRGLIHYRLAGREQKDLLLFGKLFADRQPALHIIRNMRLTQQAFARTPRLGTPEAVGLLDNMALLLYKPAPGKFLDEYLAGPQAVYWLGQTAAWLATLHTQPLALEKCFHLANELENLQLWTDVVTSHFRPLAAAASHLYSYLLDTANELTLETQTVIHKDFHYRHVLIDETEEPKLSVIDLDEMRLGDPTFDVAHFCVNLQLLAYRSGWSRQRTALLQQQFLQAYAQHTGWRHDQRFTFFFVYTCIKVARQLCLGFGPSPVPQGNQQFAEVRLILERGLALLPPNRY